MIISNQKQFPSSVMVIPNQKQFPSSMMITHNHNKFLIKIFNYKIIYNCCL